MALLHRGAVYFFGKRKGYLAFSPQKSEKDKWKNGKRYPNGCIELRADACLCLFDESRGKSLKRQVGRFSLTEREFDIRIFSNILSIRHLEIY